MGSDPIEDAISAVLAAKLAPPPARRTPRARHPGRLAARDERFVCKKEWLCGKCLGSLAETTACHEAVIFYPPGVPKEGCGRIFTTHHGLTVKHPENFNDAVKYPYGCLSDILPADERRVK